MAAVNTWTCQRTTDGVRCKHVNPKRNQICARCAKKRPPFKRPAHLRALELPYEEYVRINGGEHCGICGRGPSENRRLDRDHDHKTGEPRGLLCWLCNTKLDNRIDADWAQQAAHYLGVAEQRAADYLRRAA